MSRTTFFSIFFLCVISSACAFAPHAARIMHMNAAARAGNSEGGEIPKPHRSFSDLYKNGNGNNEEGNAIRRQSVRDVISSMKYARKDRMAQHNSRFRRSTEDNIARMVQALRERNDELEF